MNTSWLLNYKMYIMHKIIILVKKYDLIYFEHTEYTFSHMQNLKYFEKREKINTHHLNLTSKMSYFYMQIIKL